MVAYQGKSPTGELYPDLVAAACEQTHMDKAFFSRCQAPVLKFCFFHTGSGFLHYKHLVLAAVFEEKIREDATVFRLAMNHGHIFFYHLSILNGFR